MKNDLNPWHSGKMFKGFRKIAVNVHSKGRKATIEYKRQKVVDGIDAWLARNSGEPVKRVQRLSTVEGETRLVWLKYWKQKVPLTAAGDLVGEIGLEPDEAAFWHWMKEQVRAGAYDSGIEQVAAEIGSRFKGQSRNR